MLYTRLNLTIQTQVAIATIAFLVAKKVDGVYKIKKWSYCSNTIQVY